MRIPFFQKKRPAPNSGLPRSSLGQFSAREPGRELKQAQADGQILNSQLSMVDTMFSFMDKFNDRIDSRVAAAMEEGIEPEPNGLAAYLPLIQSAMPYIAPYIPGIMERLGISATTGVPPSEAPPSPSSSGPAAAASSTAAGQGIIPWINRAAEASPKLIKPFIPKLLEEAERQGIDPVKFKQAIINISKAIQ